MDPSRNTLASMRAPDAPADERHDVRCREIVDHAIGVLATSNTMSAVEYLKSHDIAAHIIERVLLDPSRRRSNVA